MKRLILLLMIASPAAANTITPNFTQGSMQSTTSSTIDISRTIATNVLGGSYASWSGTNITASGDDITATGAKFTIKNPGEQFQLEIVTRAAGKIEDSLVTDTIKQVSTTTSLSVFSQ